MARLLFMTGAGILMLPLLLVLTDFAVFAAIARSYDRPAGAEAYMAYRTGDASLETIAEADAAVETAPTRNFATHPLTLEEKRARAESLASVLPPAPAGWTLAPYSDADHWAMRPEQAHCVDPTVAIATVNPLARICPTDVSDGFAMVYRSGKERIVIRLRYENDVPASLVGGPATRAARAGLVETFFGKSTEPPDHTFEQFGRWRFGAMTNYFLRDGWPPLKVPSRLHAQRHGHGSVDVWVVSNAAPHSIRAVLGGIDYRTLDALVAPLAIEG